MKDPRDLKDLTIHDATRAGTRSASCEVCGCLGASLKVMRLLGARIKVTYCAMLLLATTPPFLLDYRGGTVPVCLTTSSAENDLLLNL